MRPYSKRTLERTGGETKLTKQCGNYLDLSFEWDIEKDRINQAKHGVSFSEAQHAFLDPKRVIAIDRKHSTSRETRHFCFGVVHGRVLTVRFTYREGKIRIFGAGYWREGRTKYEQANRIS